MFNNSKRFDSFDINDISSKIKVEIRLCQYERGDHVLRIYLPDGQRLMIELTTDLNNLHEIVTLKKAIRDNMCS